MLERGIVINRSKTGIDIQMQPSGACENCNACLMDKSKLQTLHIEQQIAVNPGEIVEVEVRPEFALKSAFLIFFLPLLMLILGYYGFQNFLQIPGLNAVYRGALGSLVALILTFIGVHFYDKRLQKSDRGKQVKIVRIVS